ncbi:phosphopantetheine-binding protein [Streptomyces sp. OfavH-34-F]|uniref:acyl carrier protein n=1 Tax=Streptomyces sp. OfavH-34-F TaxID=2917760 RepID=UPI001EF37188|nr:phosphopantetheine-binding protein [Streptomyces sp. OfavH-34-F]MCG7524786.1 phosphopantetheine-binding protein [Streptomyces sp. OfavH-34-F]
MPDALTDLAAKRTAEIRDIVADLFSAEPAEVETATSFVDDLDADSLLAIELLTHLERRYGVSIREDEIVEMTDLKATYEIVARNAGW